MMASATIMDGVALPLPQPPVPAETLPSSHASELVLVPATATEDEQCSIVNSVEWKGPLSLDQYIERERVLRRQDLTNNNRLTPWILTSKSLSINSDGTRPILASCETLLKDGLISRNGTLENVRVHGIASVFTRPEYRGKGYAGRMMAELGKRLEGWQQENGSTGSFSVLFSDIGRQFYDKFGWKAFPSTHIHLTGLSEQEYIDTRKTLPSVLQKSFPDVEDLSTEDVRSIPMVDWLEANLKATSELQPNMPHVAIRPDMQHFSWHFAREEVLAAALGLQIPQIKGAVHRKSGLAVIWERVFAPEPKDHSLHILHVAIPPQLRAAPTPEDRTALSALLLRAQREAHAWDMRAGLEVWDPTGFVMTAAQQLRQKEQGNIEVITRDKEHICSLRWTGSKSTDPATGDVVWVSMEKYAWC